MTKLQAKENWKHIEYVSKRPEARQILKLLSDNNELYFNDFKDIDYHNVILENLVGFGLIETDKSIAYGHTKKYIKEESAYRLTNYGSNFFPMINQLAILEEQTVVPQITPGEFAKFKDELSKFIYSKNNEDVRNAFEFIFGGLGVNFYKRSQTKLNVMDKELRQLRKGIIAIENDEDYNRVTQNFRTHVLEFIAIANEITTTLRYDAPEIEKMIQLLKKYYNTSFYEEKAKQIEGVQFTKVSSERLEKNVNKFIFDMESKGIYQAYLMVLSNIIAISLYIEEQLNELPSQISIKNELVRIAKSFSGLLQDDAKRKFSKLVSNKKMHHLTEHENSSFTGNVLVVSIPAPANRKNNENKKVSRFEKELVKDKEELKEIEEIIKRLETLQKIPSFIDKDKIYSCEVYELIKESISNSNIDAGGNFNLIAKITSSNKDFKIKTRTDNGKVKQLTLGNSEVNLYVNENILKGLSSAKKKHANVAARIADKESNRPVEGRSL